MIVVEGEEPWAATDHPAHGQDPRVVGVEDVPSVGAGDPGDGRLHLGELIERSDAVQPEVVGRDVRDDGDVVARGADAAEQDPAPRRLEDGDVDAGLSEGRGRAAEA